MQVRPDPGLLLAFLYTHIISVGLFLYIAYFKSTFIEGTGQTLIISTTVRLLPSHSEMKTGCSCLLFTNANMGNWQIIAFKKKKCLSFNMLISYLEWNSALFIGLVCPSVQENPLLSLEKDIMMCRSVPAFHMC